MWLTWSDTGTRISRYERKNKIGRLDKESVWMKFLGNIFGLWIVLVMLPAFLLGHLFYQIAGHFEAGSLFARIFGDLIWVVLYISGVFATYWHVRWREKNIPHLLKSKEDKD